MRGRRRRSQPRCPGFLSPFGCRHSLLGHPLPAGELGLPHGRLTGHRRQGRTPTGLSRCTRMRCGRGGCPLYPEDCGAHTAGWMSPTATRRFATASPCTPDPNDPSTGASCNEASPRVHTVHPSGLPLTCNPTDGTRVLGLSLRASHPAVTSDACRSGDGQWAPARATSPSPTRPPHVATRCVRPRGAPPDHDCCRRRHHVRRAPRKRRAPPRRRQPAHSQSAPALGLVKVVRPRFAAGAPP